MVRHGQTKGILGDRRHRDKRVGRGGGGGHLGGWGSRDDWSHDWRSGNSLHQVFLSKQGETSKYIIPSQHQLS